MAQAVLLAEEAKGDLQAIAAFLTRNDSPEAARAVLTRIREAMRTLATLPGRGHLPPELEGLGGHPVREIHSGPYRILYETRAQEVFVHAVLDARRDLRDLLLERLVR
ncbi:type II toxin-antitoxin system RelE/ParE family toxin [Fundidesulfovibrio soli]|uniref:type II toxin-antitoxin system RelE/ParE family toxin n=1 Tax=Fundidesulfovibrio soli TaxID=2922716 RepID=UPI001FB03CEC|nr:type II toxin-antitoxin system RelE/ParE family toxin [Fundidesulfovibrio soli]